MKLTKKKAYIPDRLISQKAYKEKLLYQTSYLEMLPRINTWNYSSIRY